MLGDFLSSWALIAVCNYEFMSVVIQLTSVSPQMCKFHEGKGQTSVFVQHCISGTRTQHNAWHLGALSKHLLNNEQMSDNCEKLSRVTYSG